MLDLTAANKKPSQRIHSTVENRTPIVEIFKDMSQRRYEEAERWLKEHLSTERKGDITVATYVIFHVGGGEKPVQELAEKYHEKIDLEEDPEKVIKDLIIATEDSEDQLYFYNHTINI